MSSWESQVTPQEAKYFNQLFQVVSQSQDGIVTGAEAVRFFAGSGVPNQILSEIWETADRDKVGYLTPETFAIALKLIACAQHGKEPSANVLSTVVALPQFDGANGITSSPFISKASVPPPSTASPLKEPIITPEEREKYYNIFKVHQPFNGMLDANTAKAIFIKSKLPTDILSQIWNLADVRQSGTLNQAEFAIAMHYIAKLMDGTISKLPDQLPPAVFQSANSSSTAPPPQSPLARSMTVGSPAFQNARQQSMMTPPQRARTIDTLGNLAFGGPSITEPTITVPLRQTQHWDVTAAEKQQFDTYFAKIDSGSKGVIGGKEAVEFFKNSRLPEADLAHIWDLADTQQRGALSREEFAVAMHLIHKRLTGETLPNALPPTLIPPSNHSNVSKSSPFDTTPTIAAASTAFTQNVFASPKPQHTTRSLLDDDDNNDNNDLLGEFADDNISRETNQVNLLQNQISSLSMQTRDAKQQATKSGNMLEQLLQQKKELEAQLTSVRMAHETAVKDLNEIQETVRREEVEWNNVKAEYDAAQNNLSTLQNEMTQLKQTLENGRAETDHLRRRVAQIQEETRSVHAELDNLRAKTKQQEMMIDINRRQVTAAEQDRADARRHLEDYKVAANLTKDGDDADEDSDSSDDEVGAFAGELSKQTSVPEPHEGTPDMLSAGSGNQSISSPKADTSAMSTPALDNLFGITSTSPKSSTSIPPQSTSPFMESRNASNNATSSSPFDLFTADVNNSSSNAHAATSSATTDFDAIFGTFASPSSKTASASASLSPQPPTTASPANDPLSWATNAADSISPAASSSIASPTTTTKSTRGPPPPPPPQSRHHRQPSESMSSVASGGAATTASATPKKQRAPPPPPPTNANAHAAIAPSSPTPASIGSVSSPSHPVVQATTDTTAATDQTKEPKKTVDFNDDDDEDDFEAAFSGKELAEAKIVTNEKDDFNDFDDAFQVFDKKTESTSQNQQTATNAFGDDDWAAAFGGSPSTQNANKPNMTTATATSNNDDWDAIFSTPATTTSTAGVSVNSTTNNAPASMTKTDNNATVDKGFNDAFASFGDDFGKQSSPMFAPPAASPSFQKAPSPSLANSAMTGAITPQQEPTSQIGIVGDKIEELVKMGFNEKEAKDALNRYDQDLEKASNFLLDHS